MKTFLETQIGQLSGAPLNATTFRATEAQKAVLLNIDSLISSGRNVTQQDALNISQADLDKKQLDKEQLESAFDTLTHLNIISIKPDETVEISSSGQKVVDQAKQEKDNESQDDTGTPGEIPPGLEDQPQGQDDQQMPDVTAPDASAQAPGGSINGPNMESFKLIKYLNMYSKFITD